MNIEKTSIKKVRRLRSFFKDVTEAISGTEQDFTEGKLSRAILLLSIPAVLEMVMESVFVIVDIYFVSKLGANAVATVGITESMVTIIYAIAIGLGTATTSIVSRRIGEKNPDAASVAAFQAILTGMVVSILIGLPGALFSKKLLGLMGASKPIVDSMSGYTRIMLGGNMVIMMLFIINAIFRSAGDAAIAMKVLWIGNIINIILDPCLIFGLGPFPHMGVTGAAVATNIGRGIAVLVQFYLLFFGRKRIRLSIKHLLVDFKIMVKVLKLSFGSIGQNLGAKKPDRAERAVWVTGWINMILISMIGLVLLLFPETFIRFFITNENVIKSGVPGLRIISIGFIAYGLGMVLVNSFNGAGDTSTPLKINIFAFWLVEIPLAWLLAIKAGFKEEGVFIAIVVAESLMTLIAWLVFRRGKWKLKEV